MKVEVFKRASKVFFYGTMDEAFSVEAASQVSTLSSEVVLENIHQILTRHLKKSKTKRSVIEGHLNFSPSLDLSFWKECRRNSSPSHYLPLLYKWVGEFSDVEIARVLQITEGSLKSRYNRGLLDLGEYLLQGAS